MRRRRRVDVVLAGEQRVGIDPVPARDPLHDAVADGRDELDQATRLPEDQEQRAEVRRGQADVADVEQRQAEDPDRAEDRADERRRRHRSRS